MIPWVLGIAVLATAASASAQTQDPCKGGRPVRLISNLVPAVGQSPLWAATGGKPLEWVAKEPVRVLWLRDVTARGAGFLSGKLAGQGSPAAAKPRFATAMLGTREERLKLDFIGAKPPGIKDADLQKYAFHWTFVWFPSPGCYEITGRVGSAQSLIYLNVVPAPAAKPAPATKKKG
jgi:hypothetical protein